ncbi:MAG: gamma-glutamylcyclotransferase family protein [Pseudomonadota bacterium]
MGSGYVFGYGSLVNRRTHEYADTSPGRLSGWRREWRHTALRPVAYLTAVPDPASQIDGLVARVEAAEWTALDERERAYDRVLAQSVAPETSHAPKVQVYTIPSDKHAAPSTVNPVLLSYVDVVVQGFLDQFGTSGVARFFATTAGWEAPVADDRHNPVYGRAQTLTQAERAIVDQHLDALGCRRVAPPVLSGRQP